jgi:GT2 family glycosyltransferase
MMNLKAVKAIGGFNPIFFMYGEDLNYCQRAINLGYKIGLCTKAFVIHNKPDGDYQSNLKKWCRVTSSFYLTKCLTPENPESILFVLFTSTKGILSSAFRGRLRESFAYCYTFLRLLYLWPLLSSNRKKMLKTGVFLDLEKS